MIVSETVAIDAEKVSSVIEDAYAAIGRDDRGLGALHAVGYARGVIETLGKLGLLSSLEFNRLEHNVMIAEADADMAAELDDDEYCQVEKC